MAFLAVYRAVFGSITAILVLFLVVSAVTGPVNAGFGEASTGAAPSETSVNEVADRDDIIVMTGQTFGDRPGDALMAFNTEYARESRSVSPDEILYYNNSYDEYHDVDPVPGTEMTVLYVASTHLSASECEATQPCTFNAIEQLNMSTDEVTRFYSTVQPQEEGNDVHDVDRISESELLIADTVNDRVYILNTTTNLITWEWDAKSAYPVSGGGPYPEDWTHLNDAEYLPDRGENGWIMTSLRNQDQVVFIDRERGLVENWTLGAEDQYDILYEQHNPDYIPPENGGPAVIIADSQNDRVVEYQREDGEWVQTWEYTHLDWPRDADRLPNGNTLIVDSNGGRLLEVEPNGKLAWWTLVPYERDAMYEAEKLGTGDESTGGPSAASMNAEESVEGAAPSARVTEESTPGRLESALATADQVARDVLPPRVRNGLLFVVPFRMTPGELLASGLLFVVLGAWGTLELRRQTDVDLTLRSPILVERK